MKTTEFKIWPPFEIMYIESMLTIARSAMEAQTSLQLIIDELESGSPNTQDKTEYIIDLVQNLLGSAAALSRYFWPVRTKSITTVMRAEKLREAFSIADTNPLKNRDVRNLMEHFDEKLDEFLSKNVAGTFIPSAVGKRNKNHQGTFHYFRAFHTDDWTFEILATEVPIIPIISEIIRIYLLLEKFKFQGGRLPKNVPGL